MNTTICVYHIRGPFGSITGYGATQLDAKQSALATANAQEARVKRGKTDKRKAQDARVKQFSG